MASLRRLLTSCRHGNLPEAVHQIAKTCLVVDMQPTGNDKTVTKLGKEVYQTREEAEADVKRLCKD